MGLARSTPSRAGALVALAIAVGLLLRGFEAHTKSLWLDELHSVWAARGNDLAGVIERVSVDFHPPLYFLLLHGIEALGVTDPHVQRWLSILFSMATVVPLLGILRSIGFSPLARAVACGVFATSSFQISYGVELRAYSGLQLAAVTMVWAAFTDRAAPRLRFVAFAAALGIGLYLHYFAGAAAISILAARAIFRGPIARGAGASSFGFLPWTHLATAAAIGVLTFLPWLGVKESWLFTDPAKMWRREPSKTAAEEAARAPAKRPHKKNLAAAARIPLSCYALSVAPDLERAFVAPRQSASTVFFALVLAGGAVFLVRKLRGGPLPGGARLWGPIAAAGIAYSILAALCVWIWPYAASRYFVICAWVWPIVCAAVVDSLAMVRLRAVYASLLLATSLTVGIYHVIGKPREDMRAAVEFAARMGRDEGTIFTAILWQPTWYPHVIPYDAYAPDLDAREPRTVPPAEGAERRPVVVITRSVVVDEEKSISAEWASIRKGRKLVRFVDISSSIKVLRFEPE